MGSDIDIRSAEQANSPKESKVEMTPLEPPKLKASSASDPQFTTANFLNSNPTSETSGSDFNKVEQNDKKNLLKQDSSQQQQQQQQATHDSTVLSEQEPQNTSLPTVPSA